MAIYIKRLFVNIVALLFAVPLFAQFDFPVMSGASAGMGGASVALDDDATALYATAGLASIDRGCASLAVRQNFIAQGMGYASAAMALPASHGAWAAAFINYGNKDYHEQQLSLAYGLAVGEAISIGAAFHYLRSATSDAYYQPLNRLTFSLALQYRPTDDLIVGFRAYNPVAALAETEQAVRTPALFNLGASYRMRDELMATAEVEKNVYYDYSLRFGLEYTFLYDYALRAGYSTNPSVYSFGAGIRKDHFGADLAVQLHQALGLTPQVALHYRF